MQRVTEPGARFYVEPWPRGGWAVKLACHPIPVSRHDIEEEARAKADAYRRGVERGADRARTGQD
jgi:hypothetical protein